MLKRFAMSLLISTALVLPAQAKEENAALAEVWDNPYTLMELLGATFSMIKEEHVEEVPDRKLVENAINGMLTALDPHSGFMPLDEFEDLENETKGEFGGLGLEVTMDNGLVRVLSPIDDTPAFKAGLQTGDYVTHIDGQGVVGLTLNEAVKKMRGKPKTKVILKISRKNEEPFDVTITRDIIKVQPVKYEAKGNIGYLRVITFSEKTTERLHEAIEALMKEIGKDKIIGFIIDVRNNPGGLLDQAVGVSDTFLAAGEIVSTRSRNPEDTQRFSATEPDLTNGLPLVVLINEGSASASEIVAGALQDHKRAVLVGLKTFGKGSVQTVREIPAFGGMRITTARYYTPSGRSIQAKGIEPDIVVPRAELKELPVVTGFGEGDLPGAISAEEGKKAVETQEKALEKSKKTDKSDDKKGEKEKQDYQLDRAMDILRAIALVKEK